MCISYPLIFGLEQRPDVEEVSDEPLYAYWLRRTGAARPYLDQVFATQNPNGKDVITSYMDKASKLPDGKVSE